MKTVLPRKMAQSVISGIAPKTTYVYIQVTVPSSGRSYYDRKKSGDIIIERQSPCRKEVRVDRWVNKTLDFNTRVHFLSPTASQHHDHDHTLTYCDV